MIKKLNVNWLRMGILLGALAVALGAFGAHGLDGYLAKKYETAEKKLVAGQSIPAAAKYLQDFNTGVRYHMYHVIGLIAIGIVLRQTDQRSKRHTQLEIAAWLFVVGIIFFSGTLYILTIAGPHWLGLRWGLLAPVGGLAFIAGWITFAFGVGTSKTRPRMD